MAGVMFKMKCGVGAVSNNANRVFRREGAYDRFNKTFVFSLFYPDFYSGTT